MSIESNMKIMAESVKSIAESQVQAVELLKQIYERIYEQGAGGRETITVPPGNVTAPVDTPPELPSDREPEAPVIQPNLEAVNAELIQIATRMNDSGKAVTEVMHGLGVTQLAAATPEQMGAILDQVRQL